MWPDIVNLSSGTFRVERRTMQASEERAEEMLRAAGGSMAVWSQRNALVRMILAEDRMTELEEQHSEFCNEAVQLLDAHDDDVAIEAIVLDGIKQLQAENERLRSVLKSAYTSLVGFEGYFERAGSMGTVASIRETISRIERALDSGRG